MQSVGAAGVSAVIILLLGCCRSQCCHMHSSGQGRVCAIGGAAASPVWCCFCCGRWCWALCRGMMPPVVAACSAAALKLAGVSLPVSLLRHVLLLLPQVLGFASRYDAEVWMNTNPEATLGAVHFTLDEAASPVSIKYSLQTNTTVSTASGSAEAEAAGRASIVTP